MWSVCVECCVCGVLCVWSVVCVECVCMYIRQHIDQFEVLAVLSAVM